VVGDALPGAIAELRVLARVAAGDARVRLDQRLLVIRGLSKAARRRAAIGSLTAAKRGVRMAAGRDRRGDDGNVDE